MLFSFSLSSVFLPLFYNFNLLKNLLYFLYIYSIYLFIPLFAFPIVLFSLQLIFNIYKSSSAAATAATSLQSCLTLCDPGDGSLPGSSVLGILQARMLEWGANSFSNA